jgi:hypothetical protein
MQLSSGADMPDSDKLRDRATRLITMVGGVLIPRGCPNLNFPLP